jgi:hypothetical protein
MHTVSGTQVPIDTGRCQSKCIANREILEKACKSFSPSAELPLLPDRTSSSAYDPAIQLFKYQSPAWDLRDWEVVNSGERVESISIPIPKDLLLVE